MQRNPVKSSQIKSIGYDAATQTLEIEFVHGGGVYTYTQVPQKIADELTGAKSVGSYFLRNIKPRPDLYPYKKQEAQKPA